MPGDKMFNFFTRKIILIKILSLISITALADERPYFDAKELTSPYVSWGVDPQNPASINLLSAWKKYKKKKDIVVGVVDTGIDPKHAFLEKNIFVENGVVESSNFGMDYSKNRKNEKAPEDVEGHGSHISGIMKSVYPDVKLLALKYYNATASGDENLTATIAALRYAVDHNVDLINYSGGGPGASSQEYAILKEAERKGILVIVAAGNKAANIDERSKAFYPASYGLKNVITVTAHDESLQILNSSNYGSTGVDIFAPGYRIKSSLQNGRTGYLTGTSQATAFVTGVAALIKSEYPQLSNFKIKEIIKASAKKEASMMGKCASNGRLDAEAALSLAAKESNDLLSDGRKLAGSDN
jgi:subtilisin family serine protease